MEMKGKILIVEDSLTQAMRLQFLLQQNGYVVRVASDGVKGLAAAKAEKPTIIITDVMMPEMDGYELCTRIKQDVTLKDIHVVLLTSLSDPRDVIRGLQCGADNFLTKPYDNEQLLRRVHHILVNMEMRKEGNAQMSVEVFFGGQRHTLTSDRVQIIDLLLSTFELAVLQSTHLEKVSADYRNALEDVKRAEANLRTLMDMNGDAIVVVDGRQLVRYVNPAAEGIFGRRVDEILHKPFDFPIEVGQQEITIKCAGGQRLIADMRVVNSKWDGEDVRLATIRDITETAMLRERLQTESITDSLTGLYNRRGLMTLGENQLKLASRMKKRIVCLFVDLDGFKIINDMLGHEEGDKVLRDVAQILKKVFRETDLIARVGGDEFAVLALMSGTESADELIARLQETIAQYNVNGCRPYPLSMSIGTKFGDLEAPSSITKLMSGADKRMYEQKSVKKCACEEANSAAE
ncbi:diguanylate cyclase [Desulfosporosinus sp. Sb-LF]|uniref:diguanylate cyclase n=1 Tax=Desulfosporosinus sp. Sb-LF TaxID=2560027 RepID=UPI00107F395D|nr:diguanylate cyclase [Desulfosporosinus sp. Sb-LF]TGE32168.1 diguanylate cyclase [Desulfosporosinus sp. Sb-LF]